MSIRNKLFLFLFLLLAFSSCKKNTPTLVKIEANKIEIDDSAQEKQEINAFIEPYKKKVDSEMKSVISYTPKDLVRTDGERESSLGNLLADLCYERANPVFNSRTSENIDFAMFNYGGIRAGITKGNITNEHAFKLMPFENSLVVVEMTAEKVLEWVEYLKKASRAHPVSKQVNLTIYNDSFNLKLNERELDMNRTYHVLTSDYLQNGGDNMLFFKNPVNLYKLDYKVRNAIIDYFKSVDTVKVKLDGRIKLK